MQHCVAVFLSYAGLHPWVEFSMKK